MSQKGICGTSLFEGPGQHLLTVFLSMPYDYLPFTRVAYLQLWGYYAISQSF
jgi:hypothetical protein